MKTFLLMLFTAVNLAVFAQNTPVVQVEYFFDADNGVGKNTLVNVTPAADGTFPFAADVSSLSVGYHKLYIRTKDGNGKWSFTARRNVEMFAPDTKTTLVSGEYFIDADPGYGAAMPITIAAPDSSLNLLNFTAATSNLSVGYHKLYGRLKDNLGRWSLTFRRNIEMYKNVDPVVTKAEYFFTTDNGYGNCNQVTFAQPAADGSFSFVIPQNGIPAGADTLFIRVMDDLGKWAITQRKIIPIVLPLTLLGFDVQRKNDLAQLTWQTANEIHTAYFNVQRSTDGGTFATIGQVAAKGNSAANNDYAFTNDISTLSATKIYYRLQMMDKDGKFDYSSIKAIDISSALRIVATPNPVINGSVHFNIYSPVNAKLQLAIYNCTGKRIYNDQFGVQRESVHKTVDFSSLAAGSYLVVFTDNGNLIQTVKLIKQ